jgi:signal transduction histidine kinase/DNA-binding LacI/PurR family transcriptional regulator
MQLKQMGQRLTIGFLTHGIDFKIGFERYAGIAQKAIELDYNLICVMHEPRNENGKAAELEYNNLFYQLLSGKLHGLICGIAPSNYAMTSADITQLINQYQVPLISLTPLEKVLQVRFNDYQGMRQVLLHLIETHGIIRIFYVRGPEKHLISRERYQAYQDLLEQYGYFDPKLVSPSVNWNPKQELLTVEQLLGDLQPGRDFEAIVAANDMWALEFIEKLQEKGVRIPADIAVTGINNSFQGENCSISLTTVAHNFHKQGAQALQLLSEALQGKPISELLLDTTLVTRSSCGCSDLHLNKIIRQYFNNGPAEGYSGQPLTTRKLASQLLRYFEPSPPDWMPEGMQTLIDEFIFSVRHQTPEKFLSLLKNLIHTDLATGKERWETWENVITLFSCRVLSCLETARRPKAKELSQLAREVFNEVRWRNLEYQIVKKQDITRSVNQLQAEMSRIFNCADMANLLAEYLPKIGFTSCYLVLYEDPQPYIFSQDIPQFSRLIMGFNQNGRIVTDGSQGMLFATYQLLPDNLLNVGERYNLVASPLFFGENQFGYLIAELTPATYSFYKILCNQIECCLWGIYLFQKQKKVEESLARSNKELEQFAYIASHDLQEPLRKIIAFGDRLHQCYSKGLVEQGSDCLRRVQSAAGRMQTLINDLLIYSRVTTKARPFSKVALTQILNEVLSDLEVKINQTRAQIDVSALPTVTVDPLQIRQLFQNLISNALKFYRPGIAPVIKIYALRKNEEILQIVCEDNGIGIEAADCKRIFGVFERLHGQGQYEGSGVGLAICKKIVERHHGTIDIESVVGSGSKFIISIPLTSSL